MKKLIMLALALIPIFASAQTLVEVDLSKKNPPEHTIDTDATGIKIINMRSMKDYKIKIEVEEERDAAPSAALASTSVDPCYTQNPAFKTAYDNLNSAAEESQIPELIKKMKDALGDVTDTCKDKLKMDQENLIQQTIETYTFPFKLKKNQNILITITRINDSGAEEKKWNIVLRTPRTVNFITHFGLTFVPGGERGSKSYYSKDGANNTFVITQMNKNGDDYWKDLSMTANFILFPFHKDSFDTPLKIGWSAGFGVNGAANFSVFTGPAIVVNDFLSITLGAGLNNQYRLKGQYLPGDVINENLNFDQLHDTGLRPSLIISLGFRLSKEQLKESIETVGNQ